MVNFDLKHLPERTTKPRQYGINMVMDKGLTLQEVEGILDLAGHLIDFVKLGFGTSVVSNKLKDKIKLYQSAGIKVYFGGTLFEAFLIRGQIKDYIKILEEYKLDTLEISDGSMDFDHDAKCKYIASFAKNFTVLSEVGSKRPEIIIKPTEWVNEMLKELEAGSSYVIAEAREAGNIGIYNHSGAAKKGLISKIAEKEGVVVSDEELDAQISKMAQSYNISFADMKEYLLQKGMLEGIKSDIARQKALDILVEKANIKEISKEELEAKEKQQNKEEQNG